MKLLHLSILCTASLLILSGCATTPKPEKKAVIDSTLPIVTLTKNGIITDMKTVAFEWKSIQDPRVSAIYLYKRDPKNKDVKGLQFLTSIDNRFKTHYVDISNEPNSRYEYAFRTISSSAEGKLSQVYKVNTLPVLQSVAWIHSIAGLPRMAKIIWRPHMSERVQYYIIERKTLEEQKWEEIDKLEGRLNAEYIDEDLEDNHVYFYRVRVETFDGIVSSPSEMVKAVTKALPQGVTHITATKDLPKKIKIDWEASKIKDFSRYYLYRSSDIDGDYTLIAKLNNNTFTDKIDEDGKSYFYRVSVVDKDGLESEHDKNTIMGMSLPKPKAPVIISAKLIGNTIQLHWKKTDPRIDSFIVTRKHQDGWFKEDVKQFKDIQTASFIDKNLKAESTYTYIVYGVDKNGIVSKPSIEAKIITPESDKIIDAPQDEIIESSVETEVQKKPQTIAKEKKAEEIIAPADLDLNEI
jgi:fibronectin type 3 domain-containing protein